MATYSNIVTYQNLIDDVVEKIVNLCINVDKDPNLPNVIKPGYSWRLSQFTRKSTNDCWANAVIEGNTLLADTLNIRVSSDIVRSQFNSFLTSKGITNKNDEVITFKGLMNFYVNAASFVASRIVLVGNSMYAPDVAEGVAFTAEDSLKADYAKALYNSGSVAYSNNSDWDKENNFKYGIQTYSANDIKNDVANIIRSIANPAGVEYAKATITFGCCSSSSSSSSSSCSSSSSLFIAYMEI